MAASQAAHLDAFATPITQASEHVRGEYLKRVATYTLGGLAIASVVAVLSAGVIMSVPALSGRWVSMICILGGFFFAQTVAMNMVMGESKMMGFVLGSAAEGFTFGWLLLAATAVGAGVYGGGLGAFTILFQAGGLTVLTVLCMCAYLWSNPKDLSMIGGFLRVVTIPMLVLMVVSFVFPIGGLLGIGVSALFVLVSAGGLFYNLNEVIHNFRTDMHIEGGYLVTLGVLVMFWNLVTLLMSLSDR